MLPEKAPPASSAVLQDGGSRCPLTPAFSRKGRGCQCHAVAKVSLSMVQEPMSVDVKQVIQELIVPDLREIKSEVKGLQTEMKRLEEKIDLHSARLDEKIDTQGAKLDNKIEALGVRLDEKIDAQGAKLDNKIEAYNAKLDDKISSLRNEMLSEFRRLDERVDLTVHVRERLVSLETRMAAYENRN